MTRPGQPYLSLDEQRTLLKIARDSLREFVESGERIALDAYGLTPALREAHGAFVTLRRGGRLRGCIGYITGRRPLAEAVIDNALNAAFRDSRFPPVEADEVADLRIEISVMTPLLRIVDPLREVVAPQPLDLAPDIALRRPAKPRSTRGKGPSHLAPFPIRGGHEGDGRIGPGGTGRRIGGSPPEGRT